MRFVDAPAVLHLFHMDGRIKVNEKQPAAAIAGWLRQVSKRVWAQFRGGGRSPGLTDAMWDLIVDTLGTAAISLLGWLYIRRSRMRYVDTWVARFVRRNRLAENEARPST
jgi:hypothetical protein